MENCYCICVENSNKMERHSMAKIDKVSGFNLGQKIANPFKTSRSMSTPNPFKYSNFEGNTLPFADVFEGFENKSRR